MPSLKRLLLITVLLCCILAWREIALLPDGKLHMHVLDVNQGDSILFVTPSGKQILIDGGPDLSALLHLEDHLPFLDRTIELLVLTHPDSDHITALPSILRRYDVQRVLLSGIEHHSSRYASFLEELENEQAELLSPLTDRHIVFEDGVHISVLWPTAESIAHDDSNNTSIVLRMDYGSDSILLPGDIEKPAEIGLLQQGFDVDIDVLKVPHHGSRTSSSTGFLLATSPQLAIVSAGKNNRFSHPHTEVIDRYATLKIPLLSTAGSGTISLAFDGLDY